MVKEIGPVGSLFPGKAAFSKGAKAVVLLEVEGDRVVSRKIQRVGDAFVKGFGPVQVRSIEKVQRSMSELVGESLRLRTVIPTIAKALVSGLAITALFSTIFVAMNVVRTGIRSIISLIKEGVEAVAEFQQTTIGLAAILGTVFKFADDQAQNFRIAENFARQLQESLIKRNRESIANIQQLQLSLQAALSGGIFNFVRTGKEAIDVVLLLSNAIATVTNEQARVRQLQQEIRALLNGQLRTTDQLAKLLNDIIPGGVQRLLDEARESGNLAQLLVEFLPSFAEASIKFGKTLEGIKTSFQSIFFLFQVKTFEPVVETLIDGLDAILDRLEGDLVPVLAKASGALAIGLNNALKTFLDIVGQGKSLTQLINELDPIIERIAAALPGFAAALGKLVVFLIDKFLILLDLISQGRFIEALTSSLTTLLQFIGRIIGAAIVAELKSGIVGDAFDFISNKPIPEDSGIEQGLSSVAKAVEAFRKSLGLAEATVGGIPGPIFDALRQGNRRRRFPIDAGKPILTPDQQRKFDRIQSSSELAEELKQIKDVFITMIQDLTKFRRGAGGEDAEFIEANRKAVAAELESLRDTLASARRRAEKDPIQQGLIRQRELALNFFRDLEIRAKQSGIALSIPNDKLAEMASLINGIVGAEQVNKIESIQQKIGQFAVKQAERLANRQLIIANNNLKISEVTVTGYTRTFTLQQRINRELEEAIEKVRKLSSANRANQADVAATLKLEEQRVAQLTNQSQLVTEIRQLQLDQANRQIQNINIAGLSRTLTITEQIAKARQDAILQLDAAVLRSKALGESAGELKKLEEDRLVVIGLQAEGLERQLKLHQLLREIRTRQERFRLEQRGITVGGQDPVGLGGLLNDRETLKGILDTAIDPNFTGPLQPDQESLRLTESDLVGVARELASVEDQLQSVFLRASSVADVVGGAMTRAFLDFLKNGSSILGFLGNVVVSLKAVKEQLILAFGAAFANAIQGLITGTSGLKEAVGGLMIAIGNLAIAMGTVMILSSFFFPNPGAIVGGLKLIAAGAAIIALGSVLGGSGPSLGAAGGAASGPAEIPTFTFQQEQVNVQQGQLVATSTANLVTATENFNAATNKFESMPAGEVVVIGNAQKGGAARILSTDLKTGKAISAGRDIALSLRGGSS